MHDAQLSGTVQTYYTVFLQKCQEPFDIVEKIEKSLEINADICYNGSGDYLERNHFS